MSIKIDRISSQMAKEISYILATEVKNHDLKFEELLIQKINLTKTK